MVDYLVLASDFDSYSGPNNHLLDLCNYLYTKSEKELTLVSRRHDVESDFLREIRFPVLRVLERALLSPINVKAIRNIIGRSSPRRIFVNSSLDTAFQAFFATGRPLLIGYNIFFLGKNRYEPLEKVAARMLVDGIVAHTNFHREWYMRRGIKPHKISVIPHCVDLDRLYRALERDSKIEKKEDPVILFVGRLEIVKGIIELLRAYEQISKRIRADLFIVGRGPLEGIVLSMKKRIERKNAKARIIHFERVVLPRLIHLMEYADVIAIPSLGEAFGLVALEAMALKKAVLATCFGGISEVLTDGVNGVIVNPFDSHQLQSGLEELISDPTKRAKLGECAYQTIKNEYDVSVVAPKFIKFLERES